MEDSNFVTNEAPREDHERWTEARARDVLRALESSGLSAAAFAEREGLRVQRLFFWKRRLGKQQPGPARFVEVTARAAQSVEVVLRNGRTLRVPESIDVGALRRLVAAVEDDAAC